LPDGRGLGLVLRLTLDEGQHAQQAGGEAIHGT
jgi:hypothetical protein